MKIPGFGYSQEYIQSTYRELAVNQPMVFIIMPDGTEKSGYTSHVWDHYNKKYNTHFFYRDQLAIKLEIFDGKKYTEANSKKSREYKRNQEIKMSNDRIKRELKLNKKKD